MKRLRITLPGSQRMSAHALLIASIADGVSKLFNIDVSDETRVLIKALQDKGISLQLHDTLKSCLVNGDHSLLSRASALTHLSNKELLGGEIEVTALQSREFIASLFIAAPYAENPVLIKVGDRANDTDIAILADMMSDFGVLVKRMHHSRFYIPVPQQYTAREYTVEPNLSIALYYFASTLLTDAEVHLQGMNLGDSKQPEIKFLSILKKMGCEVIESETEITVKGQKTFPGVNVDMRAFSDSFMVLAALAPFATTPTTITNIIENHARIQRMHKALEKLNCKVEVGSDWIKIFPSEVKAATIDCDNHPRFAMAMMLISLRVSGIQIRGAECVKQICPEFFEEWIQNAATGGGS